MIFILTFTNYMGLLWILLALQGAVLPARKKLIVEKLTEKEVQPKDKGENKKEKHLVRLNLVLNTPFLMF